MTTLEKAAKAVCEKLFGSFDVRELDRPSSVSAQSMMATRAALEALKNPEPTVIREGEEVYCAAARDNVATVWNAMLDAILNEKES